jgi:UDP-N-acetylglucosamine 2-epimerase (non-hydrolysing)
MIIVVAGARPNFMKVAPILRALDRAGLPRSLVHTGQHYDEALSGVFFRDLDMDPPDVRLDVGSGSHAEQTARVMLRFEPVLRAAAPQCVLVVGDVNSTLACALVAAKARVPVVHVEAGLRSRDRTMPEELNRLLTDQLADLCLTPSPDADRNLIAEGVPRERIVCVGNVMIDTLVAALPRARGRHTMTPGTYALATLHRPANVDEPDALARLVDVLGRIAAILPVVFPVHPRTRARLDAFGLAAPAGLRLVEPLGYLDCLALEADAALVLTDSGGMQEETTYLGVPCLTLRETTERPITVTEGTNRVVGTDPAVIVAAARGALAAPAARRYPALWDGRAADRVVAALARLGVGGEIRASAG